MTREETAEVLMMIQAFYQNFRVPDKTVAVNAWWNVLKDYSMSDVSKALDAFVRTDAKGFPPSPGQIIDKIYLPEEFKELTETEAWALVSSALRNGYYGAEKEFAKLPDAVQDAVGSPSNLRNWAMTDLESVENVIQSNFMRSYRVVLSRRRDYNKLPEPIRELIGTTTRKMPEIEEKEHERPEGIPMPDRLKGKILLWRGEDDERI